MSKKKISIVSFFVVLLVVLVGCGKADRYAEFSKTEQSLIWQGERNQSFGDSDYSEIATEDEAFKLVKEKYKLELPSYYEETQNLIETEIPSDTVKQGDTIYSLFARDKELLFKTTYTFYKEKDLQVMAEVSIKYKYSADQSLAYVESQLVSIKVAPIKGNLPNQNANELIKKMGENMHFTEEKIATGLAGYEKKVEQATEPITDEFLPVISNTIDVDKNGEFTKMVVVKYDVDGTLREIYGEISDQR